MLKKIFATLGAAVLVMGSIGAASAALVTVNQGGVAISLDQSNNYDLVSGDNLAGGFAIDHTYNFTVQLGGLSLFNEIQSIFEPVSTSLKGVKNLTIQWTDLGGAQTLFHITGDLGNRCAAQAGCNGETLSSWPYVFATTLVAGAASVHITGMTLANGGTYFLFLNTVPLPAAALLFGSALLGGGLMRRRKMIKEFGLPA